VFFFWTRARQEAFKKRQRPITFSFTLRRQHGSRMVKSDNPFAFHFSEAKQPRKRLF